MWTHRNRAKISPLTRQFLSSMKLWIDDGDSNTSFFISVATNQSDEYLSFDWTTKGHRVMIQRLTKTNVTALDRKPNAEWDTLIIENGRLMEKQHNVWYDLGKNDLIDGENWEQTKEWPLDKSTAKKFLSYSNLIRANQEHLKKIESKLKALETLIRKEAERVGVVLTTHPPDGEG